MYRTAAAGGKRYPRDCRDINIALRYIPHRPKTKKSRRGVKDAGHCMDQEFRNQPLESEELLSRIEEEGLTFRAMTAVYHNEDDFNYQFIPGQLKFKDGVVFFIDTEGHLQESGMEEKNAHPLGIEEVAPFRQDYLRHSHDYEYILCRHKDKFWLSVIRHEASETRAERIQESALAVIREYLSVNGAKSLSDVEALIQKAEKEKQRRMDELAKAPIKAVYPPKTAQEFLIKYSRQKGSRAPRR